MADKSSGILTKRFREKETNRKREKQQGGVKVVHYRNLKQDDKFNFKTLKFLNLKHYTVNNQKNTAKPV